MNTLEQANKRIELLETQLNRMKEQELLLVNANKELRKQLDENIEDNPRYKQTIRRLGIEQFKCYQDKLKIEVECEHKIQDLKSELNTIKKFVSKLDIDDKLAEFINNEWYNED